jgi:polysaccharide export outer membrane protein
LTPGAADCVGQIVNSPSAGGRPRARGSTPAARTAARPIFRCGWPLRRAPYWLSKGVSTDAETLVEAMSAIRTLRIFGLLSLLLPLAANAQPLAGRDGEAAGRPTDRAAYLIGAGDELRIFVWKNPDLSADVPVRPDGKITTPLVQDVEAQGKTPTALAADLRDALSKYIQDPVVTVVVKSFAAPANAAAIRVIGAATTPKTVPYRAGLTALDVLIEVGGLNTFANGNGAMLLRQENGSYRSYPLHLKDLLRSGDLKANVTLLPGDIIRIPERWF